MSVFYERYREVEKTQAALLGAAARCEGTAHSSGNGFYEQPGKIAHLLHAADDYFLACKYFAEVNEGWKPDHEEQQP